MTEETEEAGENILNDKRVIESIRRNNLEKEDLNRLVNDLKEEEKAIDIPEREELYTENTEISALDEPAEINGVNCHPFFVYICNMINNGLTPVIIIVGKEGLGKSMAGNVVADTLHETNVLRGDFKPGEQVVYDPLEFGLFLRNSTRRIIFFEEAGETVNKNDYNSKLNHMVAGAVRTQRKRENPYLFVTPDFDELDPRIKDKVDVLIELNDDREAQITIYEKKHGRRGGSSLDYFFDNNLPDWSPIPDVPEELKEQYDKIDNRFKGSYMDELILGALKEKQEKVKSQSTAEL